MVEDTPQYAPTLQNLVDQKSLKWIFVGGKGGVGKTTTSSSLAVEMSRHRQSVLIISTDPAHNLSDAFDQKFSSQPTQVRGIDNLFCMEIDPSQNSENNPLMKKMGIEEGSKGLMSEIISQIPGIDEATSFGAVLNSIEEYNFDLIVFDTAPTGHTLRLLNFPNIIEKALVKLIEMKEKFGGMMSQVSGLMGGGAEELSQEDQQKKLFEALDQFKTKIENVNRQFQDPDKTTFVAVCIPEFLSVYETERLAVELAKFDIDIHNIVINQVVFPDKDSPCRKCQARRKMQDKYLQTVRDIYDDFHLIVNPQLEEEVRGLTKLKEFGKLLFEGYKEEGSMEQD